MTEQRVNTNFQLQLYTDGGRESESVKSELIARGERFREIDVRDLVISPDDQPFMVPELYTPEGIYLGYSEITEVYLKLPIETINKFRRKRLMGK